MSDAEKLFAKFKYKVNAEGKTKSVKNTAASEIQNPPLCNRNNLTEPIIESADQISNMPIIGARYVPTSPTLASPAGNVVLQI